MKFKQHQMLIEMLQSMQNCSNFEVCRDATYDPKNGHVPRGFCGAEGKLEDVLLVLVFAEPGFPLPGECYSGNPTQDLQILLDASNLRSGTNLFHRNVTEFLNNVFPSHINNIDEQLKRVWLTESRHCSLASVIGKQDRLICSKKHLLNQIRLFPNARVILAGGKAKTVGRLIDNPIFCGAFAPPGCNSATVRKSHARAEALAKKHVEQFI